MFKLKTIEQIPIRFLICFVEVLKIPLENLQLQPYRNDLMITQCVYNILCNLHILCKLQTVYTHCIIYTLNRLRTIYKITNRDVINSVKNTYQEFKTNKKSIDDFFNCTFLTAKRFETDIFNLERKSIQHERVIILYYDGNTKNYFVGNKDYNKLESKNPIEIKINTLFNLFQQPTITDIEIEYFNRLNIFHLKPSKSSHGKEICVAERHYGIPGTKMNQNELLNIAVREWPPRKIFWLPSKNLFEPKFCCSTLNCGYVTKLKTDLEMHQIKCTGVQTIELKQISYGSTFSIITQLSKKFNIQFSKFRQTEFMVFDIETFQMNGILVPVSIACAGTFTEPMYFERKSDHPEHGYELVSSFLEYLFKMQKMLLKKLPSEITKTIRKLQIECDDENRTTSLYKLNKMLQYLSKYQTLKIFGFNSRNGFNGVIRVNCLL